jgi:hypothetical protein
MATLTWLAWGRPACAQFSSGGSTSGGMSSGSMFGSSGGMSSGFGGSSTSGSAFGSTSGGMGMMSAGMGGSTGMGQGMPMTAAQRLAQGSQAGGFVGTTAQQMQQNFAGAAQATQAGGAMGSFNSLGGSSGAMPAMGGGQGGMQQRPGGAGWGGAQAARNPAIRCTLAVGFDFPASQPGTVSTDLAGLLSRSQAIRARQPIQVLLEGRTAVLRGEVATEHGRELAEQLARLEGGIDQVQNEIVVAGSTPPGSPAGALQVSPQAKPAKPVPSGTYRQAPTLGPELHPAAAATSTRQVPSSTVFQQFQQGRPSAGLEKAGLEKAGLEKAGLEKAGPGKSPGSHAGLGQPAARSATPPASPATPAQR